MITVTRYIDGHPSVVIRSDDETAEKMPVSWDNGDFVHLSLAGFEIAMPPKTWERVWREIRSALENRRPRPAPLSVTGKNAEHVHTYDVTTYNDPAPVTVVDMAAAPAMTWECWLQVGEELMGPDELGLGARLAALLGHGAGTDEATDGALLDEVGRLLHRQVGA